MQYHLSVSNTEPSVCVRVSEPQSTNTLTHTPVAAPDERPGLADAAENYYCPIVVVVEFAIEALSLFVSCSLRLLK